MSSRQKALAVMTELYALFLLLWDVAMLGLQLATVGSELPPGGLPDWIQFAALLNPSTAFEFAARTLVPEFIDLTTFPESDAVFLEDWVGLVVLAVWLVVPATVGCLRFQRLDLG